MLLSVFFAPLLLAPDAAAFKTNEGTICLDSCASWSTTLDHCRTTFNDKSELLRPRFQLTLRCAAAGLLLLQPVPWLPLHGSKPERAVWQRHDELGREQLRVVRDNASINQEGLVGESCCFGPCAERRGGRASSQPRSHPCFKSTGLHASGAPKPPTPARNRLFGGFGGLEASSERRAAPMSCLASVASRLLRNLDHRRCANGQTLLRLCAVQAQNGSAANATFYAPVSYKTGDDQEIKNALDKHSGAGSVAWSSALLVVALGSAALTAL